MAQFFIGLAGAIHVYTFLMESVLWGRPQTNRTFGMSAETAEHNRLFAFNQGFYNLFLAIAAFLGIFCWSKGILAIGGTLMMYAAFSMFGAGLVLLVSKRKLWRPAMIQALPPLLGILFLAGEIIRGSFPWVLQ